MRVTLDSNILIYLENRYPRDIFTSLWENIESEALSGDACICEAIFDELSRGGDFLTDWVKSLDHFVCPITDEDFSIVKDIGDHYPGWVREDKNAGDPFIIAHGKTEDRIVVADETKKGPNTSDKNQKIPNIADTYGVRCYTFFEYMRAREWAF